MMPSADEEYQKLRAVLAECSTETKLLITEDVLALPAIRHMLLVFLKDTSRPFEDWIMEPKCRHRLTQLRERIDSQDVPALSASYEEQVALVAQERLRGMTTAPPIPATDECTNAFQVSPTLTATKCREGNSDVPGDPAQILGDSCTGVAASVSAIGGGDAEARDDDDQYHGDGDDYEDYHVDDSYGDQLHDEEEAYNMLLVMSEAIKEDAKGRFQRGHFMGAAKAYLSAAATLDERKPPPPSLSVGNRLSDAYVKSMCNAAVAGFKAAAAAPAPGEAHSLVVEACTKALERSGGKCPKARFWRARVKVCQRMYEAAEADFRKAVEEEREEALQSGGQGNKCCGGDGSRREDESAMDAEGSKVVDGSGDGEATVPNGTSVNGHVISNGHDVTSNGHGPDTSNEASATISNGHAPPKSNGSISEAARWLARVRAKIAQMDAERAKASEQSFAREEAASAEKEKAAEKARRRYRYGPGHVPRRPTQQQQHEGLDTGEGEGIGGVVASESSRLEERKKEEEGDDERWRVPKPPPLKVEGRSPSIVMNDYSMHARFQVCPEFEQVAGVKGQTEYVCRIAIGPEDRVVGSGRGSSMKAAKQEACRVLLKNAAIAWNEENPDDPIDMEIMESLPYTAPKRHPKAPETEITDEFKAYVAAWVEKVALDEIQEACFPRELDKVQRKYVHSVVEELENPGVLSKSGSVGGHRRLSVMCRVMMEGMAFMSGDAVVVVDVPEFPASPADVPDLAAITRPPPERNLAAMAESVLEKKSKTKKKVLKEKKVIQED